MTHKEPAQDSSAPRLLLGRIRITTAVKKKVNSKDAVMYIERHLQYIHPQLSEEPEMVREVIFFGHPRTTTFHKDRNGVRFCICTDTKNRLTTMRLAPEC